MLPPARVCQLDAANFHTGSVTRATTATATQGRFSRAAAVRVSPFWPSSPVEGPQKVVLSVVLPWESRPCGCHQQVRDAPELDTAAVCPPPHLQLQVKLRL
ncbi:hypothetical protein Pmani_032199 [Petrolisthes manimaculis]|uniref:Uncharacterized protein n=1 Tax=Petrolisthes manimaculis TaxID=1843537 RepID=A0AAE1TU04_9EUCA|nr:hypothetical protein Pmani_032199 [Petrolisthes manimaculis]